MMKEFIHIVEQALPFFVGVSFIGLGFVIRTKQDKEDCALIRAEIQRQLSNNKREQEWTMNTLFALAQKSGVLTTAPPKDE